MADHARSDDAAVQTQLDRFAQLSPGRDILGLERIERLLSLIGDPHLSMPPVFHVAGTNGKGSTCAFLRSILEAQGYRVHAYTSPHLVRFNERIRVAGTLIDDAALAPLLAEVLDVAEANDLGPSFFEATTAAAFLAFARTHADATIVEVGLGGRLDATNIIPRPLVCGIASLAIDHEAFLLAPEAGTPDEPLDRIAFEKAGIAKPDVPLLTQLYPSSMQRAIAGVVAEARTTMLPRREAWDVSATEAGFDYRDRHGALSLPQPAMKGRHQIENAGLAIAMIRHQIALSVTEQAFSKGVAATRWPARMQLLGRGPLTSLAPDIAEIWLDGGHNPDAAAMLARHFSARLDSLGKIHLVLGMLANKDARAFLNCLEPVTASVTAVPIPGHDHHAPNELAALALGAGMTVTDVAPDVSTAISAINQRVKSGHQGCRIAILGSLYLAGVVLRENGQVPD
jgi:dihydrofolate synthase/folylpolyglutamate synthase